MKAFSKVFVAGLFTFVAMANLASACGHRCPANNGAVRPVPQFNTPVEPIPMPPSPSANGLSLNDSIINDLPADAKRAIKAAAAKALPRTAVRRVGASTVR
jgi:hypothetical protein